MSSNTIPGLASIIIPCWNQFEFTRQCVTALVRYTRLPWELIVIDNGSTDGTAVYLAGAQDVAAVRVTVISNRENRGLPAAINQGLAAVRGKYLVMLNNDGVVTDAWLDQLTALTTAKTGREANDSTAKDAKSAKEEGEGSGTGEFVDKSMTMEREEASVTDIDSAFDFTVADRSLTTPLPLGLAVADRSLTTPPPLGPAVADRSLTTPLAPPSQGGESLALVWFGRCPIYAAPPQLVENVPYRDLDEMRRFARTWRDEHRGRWFTVPKLSGFCLLMKRDAYE